MTIVGSFLKKSGDKEIVHIFSETELTFVQFEKKLTMIGLKHYLRHLT